MAAAFEDVETLAAEVPLRRLPAPDRARLRRPPGAGGRRLPADRFAAWEKLQRELAWAERRADLAAASRRRQIRALSRSIRADYLQHGRGLADTDRTGGKPAGLGWTRSPPHPGRIRSMVRTSLGSATGPRRSMPPRRLTVLLTVAVLLAAVPAAARAASRPGRPAPPRAWPAAVTVTLLTGDKVTMREAGGRAEVTVRQADQARGPVVFQTASVGGDLYVVPSDVQRLMGRSLDPDLFNVSQLVRMRYDDTRATDLPLIVQRTGTTARRSWPRPACARCGSWAASARPPSASPAGCCGPARRRPGRRPAGQGAQGVAGPPPTSPPSTPTSPRSAPPPLGGRPQRPGRPGRGPRLRHRHHPPRPPGQGGGGGQLLRLGDVTDRDGHGTHVASVVAGSAQAAGARQGVAFEASLLNGKVLDDFGFGSESGSSPAWSGPPPSQARWPT